MDLRALLDASPEASDSPAEWVSLDAGEILLGRLDAIDESGRPIVSVPQFPQFQPSAALATVAVLPHHLGRDLALMFTRGADPQPVILGFIHSPLDPVLDAVIALTEEPQERVATESGQQVFEAESKSPDDRQRNMEAETYVDGKRVVLEGKDEVVLRCGESSITLHSNGKISIRGKYLLSRASGVNRILGGSVQVN